MIVNMAEKRALKNDLPNKGDIRGMARVQYLPIRYESIIYPDIDIFR